jgi:hypothetical protein
MLSSGITLGPHMEAALGMYLSAQYVRNDMAKFVLLITVVECLAGRKQKDEKIVSVVKDLESIVEASNLSDTDKNYLFEQVRRLRQDSIRRSCLNLLKAKFFPSEDIKRFDELYAIRSSIVHEGRIPQKQELLMYQADIERIVERVMQLCLV